MLSNVRFRPLPLVACVGIGLAASACGSDEPAGDAQRFCGEIEVHQATLTDPDITTSADVDALVMLYQDIGELAPLAIEEEWDQLTLNYETASTVVPGDAESLQDAVAMAYRSEQAGALVKTWLVDNCALDIGPVATLVPQS